MTIAHLSNVVDLVHDILLNIHSGMPWSYIPRAAGLLSSCLYLYHTCCFMLRPMFNLIHYNTALPRGWGRITSEGWAIVPHALHALPSPSLHTELRRRHHFGHLTLAPPPRHHSPHLRSSHFPERAISPHPPGLRGSSDNSLLW